MATDAAITAADERHVTLMIQNYVTPKPLFSLIDFHFLHAADFAVRRRH